MKLSVRYRLDAVLSFFLIVTLTLHFSRMLSGIGVYVLPIMAVIGLVPVLLGVIRSFREKEWASMDSLASVALIFSLLSREWMSAVFIELMLAAARILDDVTRDRTEKSVRGLLKLRPEIARVEKDGMLVDVHIRSVKIGDIVAVGIGERMPVDGIVLSGNAAVDESSLTGESIPVDKSEKSRVMSGTLMQSGSLRVKTTHVGKDTTIERVIALVESAQNEKPSAQTLGERFGKIYLISVFLGVIVLFAITRNLPLVLAVVLVVCADDLAIAIPITYLRAIHAAANLGIIVKGSRHLEMFGKLRTIVFDKTGTLTTGVLSVASIIRTKGHSEDDVLEWSLFADSFSNHPISRAIVNYALERGFKTTAPDSAEEKGGKGVVAKTGKNKIVTGKRIFLEEQGITFPPEIIEAADREASLGRSVSYVSKNGRVIGCITAADTIRENAKKSIKELRELGIQKIVMLTGDNKRAAEAIAEQLGVDEWHAELMPEEKVEIIRQLQKNDLVAMVGDGVNDAAALSIAGVGVAMGGLGAEGTIDSAQIVLMRDNLLTLPAAMRIARAARRVSIEDFGIWGATNACGLALVFLGFIGPAGAAAYNFLSDFLPLFNSMRIKIKRRQLS
ncbi:MAG: cation-translocating P-type ATPase [Parcubacteria group bacterium]